MFLFFSNSNWFYSYDVVLNIFNTTAKTFWWNRRLKTLRRRNTNQTLTILRLEDEQPEISIYFCFRNCLEVVKNRIVVGFRRKGPKLPPKNWGAIGGHQNSNSPKRQKWGSGVHFLCFVAWFYLLKLIAASQLIVLCESAILEAAIIMVNVNM